MKGVLGFALVLALAGPALADPLCTCRYKGRDLALGARVCIAGPEGPRLAECAMAQNVTSWTPLRDPCTEARATPWRTLASN